MTQETGNSGQTRFWDITKHVLPILAFVIGLWEVNNESVKRDTETQMRLSQAEKEIESLKVGDKKMTEELIELKGNLIEVKTDVKHVKEDGEETLGLMREFVGRNRN